METSTTAIITIHQRIGAALAAIAIGLGAFGATGSRAVSKQLE